MDPHKGAGFCVNEEATTGKEVQRVLGFLNFLRDFFPSLCKYCGAVEEVRSARVISDGEWEKSGAREAFERAKKVLSNAPVCTTQTGQGSSSWKQMLPVWGWGGPVSGGRGGEKVCGFCSQGVQQGAGRTMEQRKGNFWLVCLQWRDGVHGFYTEDSLGGMDSKAMTFINSSTNRTVLDWINLFMEFEFVTRFKKGVLNVLSA